MYVTDKQVDEAAEIIEGWVRSWLNGEIRSGALEDACTGAACDIQQQWGLGFICEDPELNEEPGEYLKPLAA